MSEPNPLPYETADRGPITCPKCAAAMTAVQVGGVMIDRCRACGGLWLDALERERLLESGAARQADPAPPHTPRAEAQDAKTRVNCPRDGSRMIHMVDLAQPHVGFESCTVCGGVYLDAGELADLSELTLRERLRRILR